MAGTTAEQVKNQADKLESDIREEHRDAAQDALTDSENLAELQRIKQQADLDERVPQRDRPGFFERILSFFSFNSKYKSGEMSRGKNKKRSGKSYEDFLIAKLSYQASGNSAYEDSGDGLTFSRYTEGAEKSFSNDSAAINQTRTEEGQSVSASTNVTYFDRVRLINADANFKHRILGDSTAAYTSERVQLRLLGEFRDLKLNDGSMTLLHNYTAGTDKFGAIASADFSDARSGVDVSTGAFFMRDGNAAPKIIFKDGSITLSTKDFTVKMNAPSSRDGKTIVSDKNLLSITKLRQTTEINSEICLTDRGIIPPETHPKDGSPVLTSDENGRLCAGVVIDGENGEEIVEIGKPAETPEDENANGNEPDSGDAGSTMKLGPVTFTGVKRSVDLENGLNVKFSANGATIDNVDFLELGRTKAALQLSGSQPNKAVLESTALIFKGLDFLSSVELSGSEIAVDKDGVSFREISLGARNFDIGFLKAENAAVKLTKEESIAVSAEANNISIEANLGGLELSAEKLSGKLEFPEGSPALNITGGSISAGSDVLRLTLANLKYSDGTLDFGSAKAETKNIKLFGLAELSDISAETTAGSITRNGLKIGNDMSLKLSAGFSLLERKLGGLEFELDNSGFRGTFEFEKNAELISTDPFSLSASGKLGFKHEHDSGKTTPQTNGFGAKAKLFSLMELSADDIGIDSENKQFTASEMYGGIDNILSVTGKDVKLGKDGAGFSELTAEYSGFELFGGLLSVDDGQFTAKSPEKFEGVISAGFSAGEVSASVSAALEFTREKNYLPAITGIDEFSLGIGDSRLEGAKLSGVQDSGEKALDFSAKKLSIGKNEKVCISGITGSASRDRFALSSADVSINDLFGTGTLTGKIINMTADSSGLYFDKISFGSQKISLGESLSAGSAEISMSKTKQDGFSVEANNISIEANLGGLELSAEKLSGKLEFPEGSPALNITGGSISAGSDVLRLTLANLKYSDGTLDFGSAKAETKNIKLFGLAELSDISAETTAGSITRNGLKIGNDMSLKLSAGFSLLERKLGGLEFELDNSGFRGTFEFEKNAELISTDPFSLSASGKLGFKHEHDSGKTTPQTNGFGAKAKLFSLMELSADDIGIDSENKQFTASEMYGGIDNILSVTGKDVKLGKDGAGFSELTAEYSGFELFGGLLSVDDGQFTAKSPEKFEGVISAGFSAGEVSASVSAALEFTREKNYLPAITGIDEFSLGIGDSRLEGAKLSGVQDSGEKALDFSAKKLSIGKNEKVCISGITGSASRDRFALSSADVSINDLFGTGTLTGKIINMTADSSGLYFDKISFGSQKISLGESLSAGSAEISMSKTKQDGFSVTAHAENIESQMNFTPFSLKTSKLSGDVTYKDGAVSVGTSGDITLGLAELLSLTLTDLEYGDKALSFSSIKAELLKEELFGGAVKFSGLTASAEKVGFSADGISTEDGSGITITADNISLLKASFGDLSAEVTPEGFTAEADAALGSTEHTIIPNVAAAVMGKLSLNYSRDDKLDVGMNNISAFISVFDNRLSAENITAAGDSLNIETISGEFPLPGFGKDTSVNMTGKNISIGKGFRMDSLEAETNGALTFFNDMLSISGIKFEAANNFSSFTVKGSVGISAGGVSASAGGTVSVRKVNDEWSTKLKSLNDIALKVKRIGSITASSIAQDEENEKQLNITGITVRAYDPEGENATFLESIAGKNQIGVKLGLMKYYDGELHPDMSTLDFESKQIKVNIADKIGGTLDFGERSLAIEYSITLPKDYDEKETASFPELISASVYAPILPGVFVKGSAFAGAGMSSRMSLKAMFGSLSENSADSPDGVRDKSGTTNFDLTGTAALSAKAGGGVKAALVLGIPGLAQVEAGIRGTIEGSVNNSALTGNIGINYDKGQKKFSIAKDGRTGASVKFNAGLKAKLSAFVGGKLFAVIGKDLLSFNICQINLADVDFSGSAKYTPDGWKFSTEGLKMSSDLADLFKNRGITVDTTKKNLKMGELNSLLGDIQENCAPLLGGRLGTEEAMESAAKYQAEIFPALEELRSLADSSFEALAKADRQYYTEKNHSWEDADARELSAEDADATIAELQGGSTNLRALAKEILDDRIKFRNRESTIMPDKDTGIVDTAAIRDHLNGRPGFRSPAAILAALSKDNYFNSSDKNAWIEDKMKRYINVRVAINSVYRNPVEKGAGTAALTTYNITLDSLKNTTQTQKNGITSSMQEYKETISETISDYNSLDKLNRELMELMGDMDKETRKLREKAKDKEPGSSKKLEELAAKKEKITKDISDLRATISKTSGLKRQNAIDTIYGLNESLKSSRSQLSEARDIYAHKDAKKGGSLLDISEFVNDDTSPYTDQRYNISRLKPFLGAKYVVGEQQEFVSKNEFRRAAWTALLHNADENENDLALFVKSVIKFKAGEVHGTVSNQMLKTMYSNQAYAKVTNTEISDESHNVDLAKLRAANKEQVEQMREEAGKQEDKMSAIEKLVYESNDSYIRAERLYLRLMDIQPGNFENELSTTDDNAAAYVRQAAGYSNAINTLKDNIELTMAGGPLSREHINQLKSSANQA